MEAPHVPPPAESGAPPRVSWPAGLLGALVVAHFTWVCLHFAPAYLSPDANGYFVQARLIATEGRTGMKPESVVQYVGMHWLETDGGRLRSRYPAGLPVLLAAAYKLGGPGAAFLVNPVLASVSLLLVFGLARRFAGEWGGLLAAAVVATTGIVNQHALSADAHIAAMFFLLAGTVLLLDFADRPAAWGRGIAGGALLGALPTVRYPEAVCGLAVAAYLAARVRPVWRAWPAVLGAAAPLGLLLAHNQAAFGAFWKTGYSLTNEQTGFSWANLSAHALNYLRELGGQAGLLFFGLGVAGLAALAAGRRWRAEGLLFVGMMAPLLALYMAYYWGGGPGGGGGGLRFLIPLIPFFALGGAYLLMEVVAVEPTVRRVRVGVVAGLQLAAGVAASRESLAMEKTAITGAAQARRVLERATPEGSLLIVEPRLADTLEFTGRWKLADASVLGAGLDPGGGPPGQRPLLGGQAGSGLPRGFGAPDEQSDRPSPRQQGKGRERRERYAGLTPAQRAKAAWADIREWAGGRPIFWVGRSVEALEDFLPEGATMERVTELEMPVMARPGGLGLGAGPGAAGGQRLMAGRGIGGGRRSAGQQNGPGGGRPFLPGAGMASPGEEAGKRIVARVKFSEPMAQK